MYSVQFEEGMIPKNKDQRKFVLDVQEEGRTKTYLTKKREIKSIYDGITYAKDLPNDHVFGVKSELSTNFKGVMQNRFTGSNTQENFENVEKQFKPHLQNNTLKPPKPTNANLLRTRKNFKSLR